MGRSEPTAETKRQMVLDHIISLHAEDAAFLWGIRDSAVSAPDYSLLDLLKLDDRIQANLDGIRIAANVGWDLCESQLSAGKAGEMFAALAPALEIGHEPHIARLLSIAERALAARRGLCSAFGWVHFDAARDTATKLLVSSEPFHRWVGLTCFAIHRVDPESALSTAIESEDETLRARALRAAGELARQDLASQCSDHLHERDDACRFWAAWSSVVLGKTGEALGELREFCFSPGPFRRRAMHLALRAMQMADAHRLLDSLARSTASTRFSVEGAGIVGDPERIQWLLETMRVPNLARPAAEAFELISGVNIAFENFKANRPEGYNSGPSDDPNDPDVEMDDDRNLVWPDTLAISEWWQANSGRFQQGHRYICGRPLSVANCKDVLRSGLQRQRIAAALYLTVLQPGYPLFEWRAPAWNQLCKSSRTA
jgi:uncharacterized protein (TIGR02270 family)